MRIAINARFLIKDKLEGIGWYTYEITKRLVESHPEHEFILIHDRPLAQEFKFGSNVKTIKTWIPTRHAALWYLWFEHSIPRILKREKADIFLSFDGHLSLRTKTPTVFVLHDLAYLHYPNEIRSSALTFYKYFIPKYIHRAEHIISVSKHGKNDLQKNFPQIQDNKISIVGNGVREIFKPIGKAEKSAIQNKYTNNKPYLIYVGAVQPRKNIGRIIQSMQMVVDTYLDIQLLIVGRQAWKTENIRKTWEASACRENIKFLGYVEDPEMAKLMAGSEALVYTSLFEGFGVPVLEAMHCEVPIITSEGSSMEEVANGAALLVDPLRIDSIGTAMLKIIKDDTLREKLIEAGRQQRVKYNWDIAAQKISSIVSKLCAK